MELFTRLGRAMLCVLAAAAAVGSAPSQAAGESATTSSSTTAASSVKFSAAEYSVAASAGTAALYVDRVGAKGAGSIKWGTNHGSGYNKMDYTGASGTLSWSDGDTAPKKILIKVSPEAFGKTFEVILTAANAGTAVASPSVATVTITAPSNGIPAGAQLAGYRTRTFGPAVKVGTNWYDTNFFGQSGAGGVNNSDGTVSISGAGVGSISTAMVDASKPNGWRGIAFGGGAYFEAVFSFKNATAEKLTPRWPSFWANDIENMSANAVTAQTQWYGQPHGYGNWIEADFFEYDRQTLTGYGVQIHHWYGYHTKEGVQSVKAFGSHPYSVPAGYKWSDAHKYGFLWVPATATAIGYAQAYLDDVAVGDPAHWTKYEWKAPPVPIFGTTAFNVLDARHLALTLDTGTPNPMTVHSVTVWQKGTSANITE